MKSYFVCGVLMSFLMCPMMSGRAAEKETAPKQVVASELPPEKTIAALVEAFNSGSLRAAIPYIMPAVPPPVNQEALARNEKIFRENMKGWTLTVKSLRKVASGPDEQQTVEFVVESSLRNEATHISAPVSERLSLHRMATKDAAPALHRETDFTWQVIADPSARLLWTSDSLGVLTRFTLLTGFPENYYEKNPALLSMLNIKQLTLGALQLAKDYSEIFAFNNDNFKEKLFPYIRNDGVFTAPGGETNSVGYMMNVALENLSLAQLNEPAQTVAIYESKDGALDFRYDGKAAVGFADGRVKLISREEAKELRWKP